MVKFLVMDVDGTLTDGKIYMGKDGEVFKVFDIKDGCGIKDILPQHDIIPIIITARKSTMLENRCKELSITYFYQNIREKLDKLKEIIIQFNAENKTCYSLKDCAYIGDDILDLQCMLPIKEAGGIVGCPKNAVKKVLLIADYIADHDGGDGAVRDFIEWILEL